jgi:hypothetical protein
VRISMSYSSQRLPDLVKPEPQEWASFIFESPLELSPQTWREMLGED